MFHSISLFPPTVQKHHASSCCLLYLESLCNLEQLTKGRKTVWEARQGYKEQNVEERTGRVTDEKRKEAVHCKYSYRRTPPSNIFGSFRLKYRPGVLKTGALLPLVMWGVSGSEPLWHDQCSQGFAVISNKKGFASDSLFSSNVVLIR